MTSVGIDVSKKTLDVCVLTSSAKEFLFSVTNDNAGFSELVNTLSDYDNVRICLEATSIYHCAVAVYLHDANYFVCVENPAKIHYFAKMQMSRLKTDKQDARLIAKYCQMNELHQFEPCPASIIKLREFISMLQHLKSVRAAELTKLHDAHDENHAVLKRIIKCLGIEIDHVTSLMDELINSSSELNQHHKIIGSVPGLGPSTAAILLSVFASKRFKSASEVVAYFGLNPQQRKSGISVFGRERISKIGKSELRASLYMPALTAFRYNLYGCFIQRLIKAGKPKRVIITALMRKLVVYAFTVFRKQELFKIAT